jgi:hypothetical protein
MKMMKTLGPEKRYRRSLKDRAQNQSQRLGRTDESHVRTCENIQSLLVANGQDIQSREMTRAGQSEK